MTNTIVNPVSEHRSKNRGCLIGCLTAFLIVCLLVGGMVFVAYHYTQKAFNAFTDTEAVALPTLDVSPEEEKAVVDRLEQFTSVFAEEGEASGQVLTLSGEDLNILLRRDSNLSQFHDAVYFSIENNTLLGQVSIPLEKLGLSIMKGRYVNGTASFSVSFVDERLLVFLESMSVKGNPVPEEFLSAMKGENLAKEFSGDPEFESTLAKIESIAIEDDHLKITLK
jgi:hypothetical protein